MKRLRRRRVAVTWKTSMVALCAIAVGQAAPGGHTNLPPPLPLARIAEIHALSKEEANRGLPVRLRAVVTFYSIDNGRVSPGIAGLGSNLFVQDSTGGNWVAVDPKLPRLRPGQLIELEGVTAQTDFAPDITHPRWRVLGGAPMPVPVRAEFGQLASTKLDSRWVEIEGIIHSADSSTGNLRLNIAMDGGNVIGYMPNFVAPAPTNLIDAKVRIRGVCGAMFNEKNQIVGVTLFIPDLKTIRITEARPSDPFTLLQQPIDSILRFTVAGASGHRVRIRGVVTLQRPGRYFFVKGTTGNIRVESEQKTLLHPGDEVDAVGFPSIGEYNPVIKEAIYRVVGHANSPTPVNTTGDQLRGSAHDGELVQLEAELLDRTLTPVEQTLIAKNGTVIIRAESEHPAALSVFSAIQPGSRLRITGVCSAARVENEDPDAVRVLLRSPQDVVVLSSPPWWTFRRAIWLLGAMTALILTIVGWLIILRRKIQEQTKTIQEKLEREVALEHRYRGLFEHTLAGVYRMTLDGKLVDCNDAFAHILGYSDRRELLRRTGAFELHHAIAEQMSVEKNARAEVCLKRRGGAEIWVVASANLCEDDAQPLIEGTIVEITDLKQTVKALEERTAYLNALIENNPLAIAVMDPDWRIVMCNPAFERLFLFDAAELIGRTLTETIVPSERREEVARDLDGLALEKGFFRVTRRQRKDGSIVDVEKHGVPLSVNGKVVGGYAIYQNINERIAAETELRSAKEASEAASRAKSEFLANMSHEIRTPLNGILLAAELAAGEDPNPSQKEYLDTIRHSGESLLLLLNDVLDLSKIEAGKMEIHASQFSIRESLAHCVNLLRARADQKRLSLRFQVDENVPDFVSGDVLRLRQIILNLLGNAVKFTDQGSITVAAKCLDDRGRDFVCQFSVEDTGIGIPLDKQVLIFREFEQADNTATRRFAGTGLGLAISRKLAGLLGGRLWVNSEPDHGSTFYFDMPLSRASLNLKHRADSHVESKPNAPGRPLRILVAEDNPVNQRLILSLLVKYGHLPTAVTNGSEAVKLSSEQNFDIVLMDVHMPEVDGIEATRIIRRAEAKIGRHIPIVAMTASAMNEDRVACLEAGMDDYISKPISPEQLLAVLANVPASCQAAEVGGTEAA